MNSEIINSIFSLGFILLIHVYTYPSLLFIARYKEGFAPKELIWSCLNLMDCELHITLWSDLHKLLKYYVFPYVLGKSSQCELVFADYSVINYI